MPPSAVDEKIDTLAKSIKLLSSEVSTDEPSRKMLLQILKQATARVEAPMETIWGMMMSVRPCASSCIEKLTLLQLNAPAALEALLQMGVVQDLSTAGEPKTAKELSLSCGGDELLIGTSINRIRKAGLHAA
jgi:hypothetical protein